MNQNVTQVADLLAKAEADRKQISPVVSQLGKGNVEAAYQVQSELTRRMSGLRPTARWPQGRIDISCRPAATRSWRA